jgi:prepilin-type processing-associated H-X9-DG protein
MKSKASGPGNGRQRTGFMLVELLVVIAVIGILIAMLMPAVQQVREAARRADCLNRLRQIGIAAHNFHDTYGALPPARLFPKFDGAPPFHRGLDEPSWLVRILPFVEQQNFFDQWDLSASYQAHPNEVTSTVVSTFICPTRRSLEDAKAPDQIEMKQITLPCGCGGWFQVEVVGGATGDYGGNHGDLSPGSTGSPTDFYWGGNGTGVIISSQAVELPGGQLNWVDKIRFADVHDGTSQTALAGEMHVPGDKLNAIPYNGPIYNGQDLSAFARIGGPGVPLGNGPGDVGPFILGFGSWHPGSCNFTYADGSTRVIANQIDTVTLGQVCNRADGQVQASY